MKKQKKLDAVVDESSVCGRRIYPTAVTIQAKIFASALCKLDSSCSYSEELEKQLRKWAEKYAAGKFHLFHQETGLKKTKLLNRKTKQSYAKVIDINSARAK